MINTEEGGLSLWADTHENYINRGTWNVCSAIMGGGDLRIDLISIAVAIEPRTEAWYSIKSPGLHFISTIRRQYVCDETCDPRDNDLQSKSSHIGIRK